MADRFEDLGIAPALASAAESLGWDAPTGLQRDALPVLRRGNNVVLHASAGSGHVGAYGLGILDRLAADDDEPAGEDVPADGPRVLVLVLDDDQASRTAESLAPLAGRAGLSVRAHGAGWPDRPTGVMVLTPTAATIAIRESALKLEGLAALVVDGLDQIRATGQGDELETIIDITPDSAQRVIVTGRFDRSVEDFVERHVRRSMTVPGRPADRQDSGADAEISLRYRVVRDREKAAAVAALLQERLKPAGAGEGDQVEVAVVCRTESAAERMRSALRARGLTVGDDDGEPQAGIRIRVLRRTEADRRSTRAEVISADVPFDGDELVQLHGRGGVVLVTPREREHLLRIGRRAGVKLRAMPDPDPAATAAAGAVRDRVRELLTASDLAADLALVEPLLDEYPAAEVAAAALHLARTGPAGGTGTGGTAAAPGGSARQSTGGERPGAGAPPPSDATTWTHLFVAAGSRDDIAPGDILGAMTGEAGIDAGQVGKIDVRESHTTVEVATPVAAQVIEALNGRTMKGRSLRVDYDRKSRGAAKSGAGGGGRPRGGGGRTGGSRGGSRGGTGRKGTGRSGGGRPPSRRG